MTVRHGMSCPSFSASPLGTTIRQSRRKRERTDPLAFDGLFRMSFLC